MSIDLSRKRISRNVSATVGQVFVSGVFFLYCIAIYTINLVPKRSEFGRWLWLPALFPESESWGYRLGL